MFKKILQGILAGLAFIIVLIYAFGYDYLFSAVRETYLRGESGSSLDDGKYFSSNKIAIGSPIPWAEDSLYNKKPLPNVLVKDLKDSNSASFLIIKDGKLRHEQYWEGYSKSTEVNSFSMAKGVTVMLLGKAIEENRITGLSQRLSDIFPQYKEVEFASHLTIGDLAKMEAGLDWTESYKNPFLPNARAYYGKYLSDAVFEREFKTEPGSKFEYQSGATQLLGFALRTTLNKTLAQYASEKLWKPLGMEKTAEWSTDDAGVEKTFCCLHSNSRDFAKLGLLFLNDGKVGMNQILKAQFLEEMRTPTELSKETYGLGLWINNDAKIKHYYFWGLYGQYIIIVPQYNVVIVKTGMFKDQPKDAKGRPKQVEFLVNQVIDNFK